MNQPLAALRRAQSRKRLNQVPIIPTPITTPGSGTGTAPKITSTLPLKTVTAK